MIRIETRAGHGAGKPVWMQIEDFADQFGFVANALGMPVPITNSSGQSFRRNALPSRALSKPAPALPVVANLNNAAE